MEAGISPLALENAKFPEATESNENNHRQRYEHKFSLIRRNGKIKPEQKRGDIRKGKQGKVNEDLEQAISIA
jgi:hypothetical protein